MPSSLRRLTSLTMVAMADYNSCSSSSLGSSLSALFRPSKADRSDSLSAVALKKPLLSFRKIVPLIADPIADNDNVGASKHSSAGSRPSTSSFSGNFCRGKIFVNQAYRASACRLQRERLYIHPSDKITLFQSSFLSFQPKL